MALSGKDVAADVEALLPLDGLRGACPCGRHVRVHVHARRHRHAFQSQMWSSPYRSLELNDGLNVDGEARACPEVAQAPKTLLREHSCHVEGPLGSGVSERKLTFRWNLICAEAPTPKGGRCK